MFNERAEHQIAPFLNGNDDTVRRIAALDWSATGLGPIERWPQTLKNLLAVIVRSPAATIILWGQDGWMIYNDAFSVFAGARHPELLGRKVRDGWPEATDFADNVLRVGLAGGTLAYRDQEMVLYRNGEPETVWMNLDYAPIPDDHGRPAGVMVIVAETTQRVLAERRVAAERDRLRQMFDQAPGFMAIVEGSEHVFTLTNAAYVQLMGGRDLIGRTVREAAPEAESQGFFQLLDDAYRTGRPFVGDGLKIALADREGRLEDHYLDFVYQPILDSAAAVCGIFVQGSDVTERVLAERALRKGEDEARRLADALILANSTLEEQVALRTAALRAKEARLRAIFETSQSFQGLLSPDGIMIDTNATSLQSIGQPLEAVRGVPFWETPWFANTPGARELVREAIPAVAGGEAVRRELMLDLPVGGRRWFDLVMRPVHDEARRVTGIGLEAVETTERHRRNATR